MKLSTTEKIRTGLAIISLVWITWDWVDDDKVGVFSIILLSLQGILALIELLKPNPLYCKRCHEETPKQEWKAFEGYCLDCWEYENDDDNEFDPPGYRHPLLRSGVIKED